MNEKFFSFNLDFLGFSASMLCAIHCAAIPMIVALGIASEWSWLSHPYIEVLFLALSALFALTSLFPSYQNVHQKPEALSMLMVGFLLIIFSHTLWHEQEGVLMAIGGSLIAAAHFVNWRLLRRYDSCEC